MSEASEAIADLDAELRAVGTDVDVRRIVQNGPDLVWPALRAFVRGYLPNELSGGIVQGDSQVILSPTSLPPAFVAAPLRRNDRIVIAGRSRNVEFVNPVELGGVTVRINVAVRG